MLVIKNANTFAPEPLGVVDILVAAGRIVHVEAGIEIDASWITETIDAEGRTLIPGLVDGHVHLTGGGGEAGARSRVPRRPLSEFTSCGVTTVVGVLGTDDITRSTEELLAAVRALNEEGLTAYCHTGGYHIPPRTLTGSVSGDIVHIESVIGFGELAISDHRSSQPTLAELLRLASETHVAGLMTEKAGIVHLHVGDGTAGLKLVKAALESSEIPSRVFNPTHVNRRKDLFEEALELATVGCTIDATSFPVGPMEDAWPASTAIELFWDRVLPAGRITVSSDGGGCLPEFDSEGRIASYEIGNSTSLIQCAATLVGRGHPLENVLEPFTRNPAQLLRLPRKGVVRPDADADLVLVDDEFNITDVMARGVWHVRDRKQQIIGTFE